MNLVTNASEALGGEPGSVVVRTEVAGDTVRMTVRDTGCGMDADTRARIFDPFFTTKFTGRGLGLAAVQGIVRGHGGRITVDSAPEQGTLFVVTLPASSGDLRSEPCACASSEGGAGTVLVVDDEATVRALAADALERCGYMTRLARDGVEAVELLKREGSRIDLVLLDLTMPRLAGRAAFDRLRAVRADLPIILFSGFDELEATSEFEHGDLTAFIKKPFLPSALVEAVRGALGRPAGV
jgi:CheY-like chemotaxis protein